ncbi:MAG TPA: Ig-like domain-containing protein [Candidatus Krumholzibacteria bacterium]|nr:Ig-like domain-containing protein [Candidatus Krumholzibacteria bacterium]
MREPREDAVKSNAARYKVPPARGVVFASALLTFALACAVSVPPSGGPEDKTPPGVAATVPARDSSGVDPATAIRIEFSDDMTRGALERSVLISPPIIFQRAGWDGRALVIVPDGGLQRDTTYVVRVKAGYRDSHGVPAKSPYEFAFSTGAVLDTARIEGTVRFKREPSGRAVVRCFRVPRTDEFDAAATRPDRESETRPDGTYRLRYLPANDARFVLFTFLDTNGNGVYDAPGEPSLAFPDTIFLTNAVPVVSGVDMTIIDPNEPATVSGVVDNQAGFDSVRVSIRMTALDDSTRVPLYTLCDEKGAYTFARVLGGAYRLRAFLDIQPDSTCGTFVCGDSTAAPCAEPFVDLADTLRVAPGTAVTVPALVLRKREEP